LAIGGQKWWTTNWAEGSFEVAVAVNGRKKVPLGSGSLIGQLPLLQATVKIRTK